MFKNIFIWQPHCSAEPAIKFLFDTLVEKISLELEMTFLEHCAPSHILVHKVICPSSFIS